ncbi:MAG TPA: NAD(P)H-hydrate dehydratase [Bacillales bacterium]|nr:NAD(P)H-hydrate dehydratase [Bacillales bacterium]
MHVVTGEEMHRIDRETVQKIGLSGETLMESAGRAAAGKLMGRIGKKEKIVVLAGTGNNGGDGFVIGRVLLEAGYDAEVWLIPPRKKIKGDARKHLAIYEAAGFHVETYQGNEARLAASLERCTVVVDAMLGTGVKGGVRPPYKEIIQRLNEARALTIAVDVPSGVPSDGERIEGEAVKADWTLTLQCPKTSAFVYPHASYYGECETLNIGIPQKVVRAIAPARQLWSADAFRRHFPKRAADAHKGSHGKGLIIAGSREMPGAAAMTGAAALRGGGGLVTLAVPAAIQPTVASLLPEATYRPCASADGAFSGEWPLEAAYDAVAAGPGIGRGDGAAKLVAALLRECEAPLVLDADALYPLDRLKAELKARPAPTVLTPHPGEMARLTGTSVEAVQSSRFQSAREFARTYGVWLVLKGPYTIVSAPDGMQFVNPTGNAALAKGGTGDVLTGLIFAFIMQHPQIQPAVSNAVYLHGQAADDLVANGTAPASVLATDLIEQFGASLGRLLAHETPVPTPAQIL